MSPRLGRLCVALAVPLCGQNNLGSFEGHGDIGTNPKPGSAVYDAAAGQYRITGGGANIWGTQDAFHFVWRRVSRDVTLSADIAFEGQGADPHRKAVLMVRQDLTPGSVYADIAVHGDGLTSLQYRTAVGGPTAEMRSEMKAPTRVRLERRSNRISVLAGNPGEELKATFPQVMTFTDPVYVGFGVSSHNADVLETAVFSDASGSTLPEQDPYLRLGQQDERNRLHR
jgi:TolB protein